jgi:long-subunit acyl-CoA synthetase (AMP-forming)
MSTVMTNSVRRVSDHFEPEPALDPQEQRKLRGHLEQIDYAAFAANQEVVSHALHAADLEKFQRLAVAAAQARAKWVARAVALSEGGQALAPAQVDELEALRRAYDELTQAYEALRRMVERGYLPYRAR